jgi:hypothetical protein
MERLVAFLYVEVGEGADDSVSEDSVFKLVDEERRVLSSGKIEALDS